MAGKITDLGAQTAAAAAASDLIETVDISDTTLAATGTNKKLPLSELVTYVSANGGTTPTGTKLTALTAITGAILAALDLVEVIDVSDTTMAASGTNKKITMTELVAYLNTVVSIPSTAVTGLGALATKSAVASADITDGTVANGDLANMAANTLKGSVAGGTPADLTATQAKTLLAIASGDVSGLGSLATKSTIASADITDGVVSNADLATMPTLTIKGNNTAGTAAPTDLTAALARSMLASGGGAMFGFNFDTTTTAGPASAGLRLNNATPASATIVYITYTSKDGVDLKTRLLAGTAGDRLYIQDRANSANWRLYELTGAPVDGTTYATCNVVHRSGAGSLWANATEVIAGFMSAAITIATSAPASPLTNDIWIDTT